VPPVNGLYKGKSTFFPILILILVVLALPGKAARAQDNVPSPYDLIDAVNALRAANGMDALQPNDLLMNSAQAHSEYQAALGTWTHSGPGGSNETDRAIAAGYGNGSSVICDEAVAYAGDSNTVDYVVNTLWNDPAHRDLVLLNSRYVDIGAGVFATGNEVFYTVDVCVTGSGPSNYTPKPNQPTLPPGAPTLPPGLPTATREIIIPVQTVTPQEDGSIIHIVQAGQTLWSIAIAYGTTIDEILRINGIPPSQKEMIRPGQKLYIRVKNTAGPPATITETALPPSETPRPTNTRRPPIPTRTPTSTLEATNVPIFPEIPSLQGANRRTIGIAFVVVCATGLLVVIIGSMRKKK